MAATQKFQVERLSRGARRSCVGVRAIYQCTALDVAVAGERVALHCHTRDGTVVVQLGYAEFAAKARGESDCNRRPFPQPRTTTVDQLEADAATVPVTKLAPPGTRPVLRANDRRLLSPERDAQYRAAWARRLAGHVSVASLARELGITEQALHLHFKRYATEAGAPVSKPSGKLL